MYISVKSNAMELIDDPNMTEKDLNSYLKYIWDKYMFSLATRGTLSRIIKKVLRFVLVEYTWAIMLKVAAKHPLGLHALYRWNSATDRPGLRLVNLNGSSALNP